LQVTAPYNAGMHTWTRQAIAALEAEAARSADTHLIRLDLPAFPGIPLYFKDESVHPTGSLKHRLGRSLFLYAICNGWLVRTVRSSKRPAAAPRFPKRTSHAC